MATKNLLVRGGADFSGMKKAMDNTQKSMNGFKQSISKSMSSIKITLAGLGAGLGIGSAVKDAMTFQASIEQVNRLMGQSAGDFLNWANTSAAAFNMSKKEAVQYGATFSNIISTFAKDTSETQFYTQDLLKATAVVASKTGRTMEDALERVRSGMLGNTESVEDLGIFVNVAMIESTKAFQQFANGKSWNQLDFKLQQQIRLMAILEQASTKYGVEVGNNAVSATARFVAQLNNLKLAIGQAFLPIWETVLPSLTAFVGWLVKGMTVVAQFMQVLFGKNPAKTAQSQVGANAQVASSVGGIGDAYKKAGKEAKKAQGSLAGFDEVNTLADKTANASSGDTGTGGDNTGGVDVVSPDVTPIDFETNATEISEKIKAMAERVKIFFKDAKDFIKEHKDIIIAALGGLGAALGVYVFAIHGVSTALKIWKGAQAALSGAFSFLLSPIGLIIAAVALLVGAFIYFYRTNDKFKGFVDGVLNKIKDAAIWLWKNALVPLGEYLGKGFVAAWEVTKKAAELLWKNVLVPLGEFLGKAFVVAWDATKKAAEWLWKNVLVPFGDFLKWFWDKILVPIGKVLKEVLAIAFDTVANVAKSFWKNVLVPMGEFFKATFGPAVEAISTVFKFLWDKVLAPLGTFLGSVFKGYWTALTTTIQFLWNNVLKPVAEFLGGHFSRVFNTVFEGIGGLIKGLQTAFIGLMKFITGVFSGDWKKAWEGVKQVFKGVFDGLYAIVKTPLNLIIDSINTLIGGLNKLSFKLPDWLPGDLGGKSFGINIPKIPKLAKGGYVGANSPLLAMIGDNRNEGEIVAPESKIYEQTLNAVKDALSQMGGGNTGDIVLKLNEIELGRASAKSINKAQRTAGKLLLDI